MSYYNEGQSDEYCPDCSKYGTHTCKTTEKMVEELKETVAELDELEKNRLFDEAMAIHE